MAEEFTLKGAERQATAQSASADQSLFQDAFSGTEKCMGGGPGVKCGAPSIQPIDIPNPDAADNNNNNREQETYHPQNNWPAVYYGPPVGILNDGSNAHLFKQKPEQTKQEEDGIEKINKDREVKVIEKKGELPTESKKNLGPWAKAETMDLTKRDDVVSLRF